MLSALHRLQEMDDVLARAQKLFDSYDEELRRELPADVEIFDAHVHLGNDIDGMSGGFDELMAVTDRYGISRPFMFCMDEPGRHPAFPAPHGPPPPVAQRPNR